MAFRFGSAALLATFLCSFAAAEENRFIFFDQSDFGGAKGFFLDVENQGPDGTVLKADTAMVHLGVADGKGWKFLTAKGPFPAGPPIQLRAVVNGATATLYVNGQAAEQVPTGFAPIAKTVAIAPLGRARPRTIGSSSRATVCSKEARTSRGPSPVPVNPSWTSSRPHYPFT